ncbi:thioesterase family protein [Curvibacter sp. CHRR-16]|nr:thioesterase family protein [Curvibacter sp. CHRR-16]
MHTLDQALTLTALQHEADGTVRWQGHTHPGYANMVGPYGGVTAAQMLQAAWLHPQRLGEPVSLTVNFCAAVADGAFTIVAQPVVTNRSTQHWMLRMEQDGKVVTTATAVTALRRDTWADDETKMPVVPAPEQVPMPRMLLDRPFLSRYEWRVMQGSPLTELGTTSDTSLTRLWVRDIPPRPMDFAGLAAMADMFFPRVYSRRALMVPTGTVSITVYFHASGEQLQQHGMGYVLGQVQGQGFRHGFFDHVAQLWSQSGSLLATTHQIVYYKE